MTNAEKIAELMKGHKLVFGDTHSLYIAQLARKLDVARERCGSKEIQPVSIL